jgi:hypothetical protein
MTAQDEPQRDTLGDGSGNGPRLMFGPFAVRGGEVRHGHERYPLAGAVVRVESAHELEWRVNAARLLPTGAFAHALKEKKQQDRLQTFLTITGPDASYQLAAELDSWKQRDAREFAVQVNTAARIDA